MHSPTQTHTQTHTQEYIALHSIFVSCPVALETGPHAAPWALNFSSPYWDDVLRVNMLFPKCQMNALNLIYSFEGLDYISYQNQTNKAGSSYIWGKEVK